MLTTGIFSDDFKLSKVQEEGFFSSGKLQTHLVIANSF